MKLEIIQEDNMPDFSRFRLECKRAGMQYTVFSRMFLNQDIKDMARALYSFADQLTKEVENIK